LKAFFKTSRYLHGEVIGKKDDCLKRQVRRGTVEQKDEELA